MLNVMEERDIQVRGYTLRLLLDVLVVASANPEGLHQPRAHHHPASRTGSAPRSAPTTRANSTPRSA